MSLPSNSLDTCVRYCSSNSLCNSISYCMNPEFADTWNCHLKDRELVGNAPTKHSRDAQLITKKQLAMVCLM